METKEFNVEANTVNFTKEVESIADKYGINFFILVNDESCSSVYNGNESSIQDHVSNMLNHNGELKYKKIRIKEDTLINQENLDKFIEEVSDLAAKENTLNYFLLANDVPIICNDHKYKLLEECEKIQCKNSNTNLNYMRDNDRNLTLLSEDNEINDMNNIIDEIFIDALPIVETHINEDAKPIYLITSFTFTALGKQISKFTNSFFSHAAIALDSSLENMYTFNSNYKNPLFDNGLTMENIHNYTKISDKSVIQVSTIFLKENLYNKLVSTLNDMLVNKDKYKYHFIGLLEVILNRPNHNNFKMICSEFVAKLLSLVDADLFDKSLNTITPDDLSKLHINKSRIYLTYNGYVKDYKPIYVKNILSVLNPEYLKENTILEAKEFPIDFDNDGNLIIQNYKKLDFEAEYSKSHKLLIKYEKYENLDGIKYELSKLWFMNTILEKKIYSKQSENKMDKYLKVRARILNDFNKYLDYVLNKEPDFNFTEYYNDTPFSDVKLKIGSGLLNKIADIAKGNY